MPPQHRLALQPHVVHCDRAIVALFVGGCIAGLVIQLYSLVAHPSRTGEGDRILGVIVLFFLGSPAMVAGGVQAPPNPKLLRLEKENRLKLKLQKLHL